MASTIDISKPHATAPTTGEVRDNFAAAKNDIEALQTTRATLDAPSFTSGITVTGGIKQSEAANGKQGVATLVAGAATVANTSITANSRIFLTINTPSGTVGEVYISARTAGSGFAIQSLSTTDTSVVAYVIFEP